jgi:tryptophan synthase alpha chain
MIGETKKALQFDFSGFSDFSNGQKKLSIFALAGYPWLDSLPEQLEMLAEEGVDFVEIGMPYSDPLADGATIQQAGQVALDNGMNCRLLFDQVQNFHRQNEHHPPLIWMGYWNCILQYGLEGFCEDAREAGFSGLIVPDLPPNIYADQYQDLFISYELPLVFLISPSTPESRVREIDNIPSPFIYALSGTGTTGGNVDLKSEASAYLAGLQKLELQRPLIVGFGIHDAQSFAEVTKFVDGAIIGSAYLRSAKEGVDVARTFIQSIRST